MTTGSRYAEYLEEKGSITQQEEDAQDSLTPEPNEALEVGQGSLGEASGEDVPLAQALEEAAAFNRQFIHHKDDCVHDVIALWVAHTFAMGKWNITPRLYINAPQAAVGKSTQGKVIASLSNNGIKVSSATSAYVFSRIEETQGGVTLLLDEADNLWSRGRDTSDIQAVVNDGYEYGATVGRASATDDGIKGKDYASFCPVVIIGIKNSMIPATTLSRCIDVKMSLPDEPKNLSRYITRKYQEQAQAIREALASAVEVIPAFEEMEAPEGLSLRSWDIWEPLFIVAQAAGGDWPSRVLRAAQVMNNVEKVLTPAQKVLGMTYEYLRTEGKAKPTDIANHINGLDEMFELNGQRVSYYLRQYNVESKKSNGAMWFYLEDVAQSAQQWLGIETVHTSQNPTLTYPDSPSDDALTQEPVATEKPEPGMVEWKTSKEMAAESSQSEDDEW